MTHAVFMGSPEFALPSLKALAAYPGVSLAGVVTQPDRPVGRNRVPQPSPVKQLALEMGLPVLTPASAREPELIESLRGWGVELAVVCAYGQILPESLLSLPRLGCFNLHFSLLPRWRGASPVQAAILAGDTRTGVSLQYMVKQLDAGDIVKDTGPLEISPSETAGSLLERLAGESGTLLEKAMPDLLSGHPPRTPQDPGQVTFCRIISKSQGAADFSNEDAEHIERKSRAYHPWPGCYAFLEGRRLGLIRMEICGQIPGTAPGVLNRDGTVNCATGAVRLLEVRPEGRQAMNVASFLNGHPQATGKPLLPTPS